MNLQALSRHGISVLLIAAIVACTLWIGRTIDRRGAVPAPATGQDAQGGRGEVRIAPDFTLLRPGQDLAETTDRPLFDPTRRPRFSALPAAAPASVPQTLPRGRYALAGVSILPGKRIALLRDLATGMTVRVAEKDRLGGMLVASVTPYKVVLQQDGESEELPLRVAPASGMPVPAAASAPALKAPPPPSAPPAAAEPPKP